MKLSELDTQAAKCECCRGKPDYVYFRDDDKEVLSIICQDCRDAFEATMQSMGQTFLRGVEL